MAEIEINLDRLVQLYRIYSDDLKKFDAICWQYPLALVTGNFVAAYNLRSVSISLVALTLVNFLFPIPLLKNVYLRQEIIEPMQNIKAQLREDAADFKKPTLSWWKWKSLFLLAYGRSSPWFLFC